MLTVSPAGFWGRDYHLLDRTGARVGFVSNGWRSESSRLEIGGEVLSIRRDGVSGPWLVSCDDGRRVGTLVKPSWLSGSFNIVFLGQHYELQRQPWRSSFILSCDGYPLGRLRRQGFLSRNMCVELPDDLPLSLQVVAAWLVLLMWRRAASAASTC
jgi:hypothetical protein